MRVRHTARVVAIIRCTAAEDRHLANFHRADDFQQGWESVGDREDWQRSHVALVVTGQAGGRPLVDFVAHAKSGQSAGTLVRRIAVSQLHPVIPPLRLDELYSKVPLKFRDAVHESGRLPKRKGEEVLEALTTLRPDLSGVVDELERQTGVVRIVSWIRDLFVQERDAVGMGLQIAGFDRGIIAESRIPDAQTQVSVLETIPRMPAHEDHLIAHDAQRFADWVGRDADHLATRVFRKDDLQLFVANVNRRPAEETLGVDLIYHHVDRDSFVLVQYKKMERTGIPGQGWEYRPDAHLRDQLERMRAVEEACAAVESRPPVDYRMSTQPCWLKLCKADPTMPGGDRLIGGMYLSREHFEWLDAHPVYATGPRQGSVFGYHTVPRYLGNTTFAQLVQDGWIGTQGGASDLVRSQIQASQDGNRSVVYVRLLGDQALQARRTSERRERR